MEESKVEISRDFNPSLPSEKSNDQIKVPEKPKSSFFDRLRSGISPQSQESEKNPNKINDQVRELFEKNLERVEVRIDMHRKAHQIALKRPVDEIELKTENSFIVSSYQQRGILLTEEQAQEMAYGRIMSRRVKELLQSDNPQVGLILTPEQIKTKVLQGKMTDVYKALTPKDDEDIRILSESKRKLHELDAVIGQLSQDPQVVSEYNAHHDERANTLRKANVVIGMKRRIQEMAVHRDKQVRQMYLDGRQYSPGEVSIREREDQLIKVIEEAVDELLDNPEIFEAYRLKYLQELQRGFKKDRFAETPSRQKYMDEIRHLWVHGEKILLTGPTGGGKTELLFHTARSLNGRDPEKLSGHPNMTNYEIYGKMAGKVTGEGRTIVGFDEGPFTRAVDLDNILVVDEINVIPAKMVMRMKADLNARPGQEITIQEENGKKHRVGKGFAIGATANVKSEKHPEREEMDPAMVRMFREIKIQYAEPHELYDIMLANLMDVRGGIKLTLTDVQQTLKNLCDATQWTQQAYNGDVVVTDSSTGSSLNARGGAGIDKKATLEVGVIDPGRAIDMLIGWEDAKRKGMTLREFLNPKIVSFINSETFPADDRYYLAEIFALKGFLRGVKVSDLNIPGLDQATLDSWNGYDGKRYIPSKDAKRYLPSEMVAKLDPYGVLRRSGEAGDLLDEDEQQEVIEENQSTLNNPNTSPSKSTTSVGGLNYSGLKIVPNTEAREILQFFDTRNPQLPTNLKNANLYMKELVQVIRLNPSLIEIGIRRIDQITEKIAFGNPVLSAVDFDLFLENIKRLNLDDINLETAKKLHVIVQKLKFLKHSEDDRWIKYINEDFAKIDNVLNGKLVNLK